MFFYGISSFKLSKDTILHEMLSSTIPDITG